VFLNYRYQTALVTYQYLTRKLPESYRQLIFNEKIYFYFTGNLPETCQ